MRSVPPDSKTLDSSWGLDEVDELEDTQPVASEELLALAALAREEKGSPRMATPPAGTPLQPDGEGKITLPVVLAFRRGNDEERAFWRRVMEEGDQREGDFEHALALMERHGALADSHERARHYGAMAKDALGLFPDSPEKQALLGVVDFCMERES